MTLITEVYHVILRLKTRVVWREYVYNSRASSIMGTLERRVWCISIHGVICKRSRCLVISSFSETSTFKSVKLLSQVGSLPMSIRPWPSHLGWWKRQSAHDQTQNFLKLTENYFHNQCLEEIIYLHDNNVCQESLFLPEYQSSLHPHICISNKVHKNDKFSREA